MPAPLRYRISKLDDLPKCVSNNSRDLKINVTNFLQNDILVGKRISILHSRFGVLFACTLNCHGNLVSVMDNGIDPDISLSDILKQFAKFGFLIEYRPDGQLSGDQLTYLISISNLNYDKIRIMNVYEYNKVGERINTQYVVAFMSMCNPYWLNANYSCSMSEFKERLAHGSVANLTRVSQDNNYDWSWLQNNIANIQDILDNNSRCLE